MCSTTTAGQYLINNLQTEILFYGYDLTHHLGGGVGVGIKNNFKISVNIKFDRALASMYRLVRFSERDDQTSIDSQGVGFLGTV